MNETLMSSWTMVILEGWTMREGPLQATMEFQRISGVTSLSCQILDYTFPFQCSAQCNGKEKERLYQGQLQRITGAISPLLHPSNVFMSRNVFLP